MHPVDPVEEIVVVGWNYRAGERSGTTLGYP
jgi:hypothetical protein